MGVTTQNGVEARHPRGQLYIAVGAVVREQNHHLSACGAHFIHLFLQLALLNTESPAGGEVGGVGDWCIGEGLANDRHGYPVDLLKGMARKDRVAKVHVFDVVRDEVDVSVEILINNLRDPISAQRELPMTGHDINTQQLAGVDHVLTQRPKRGSGSLPQVPAIKQQRARSICPQPLDQGSYVRKAPSTSELLRGGNVI